MKDKNRINQPEIGTFYLLTNDRTKTPWLQPEEILFVKDENTFIKISVSQGAGYSSRWDWATENAVTITKLATNKHLLNQLNLSVEIGRDIAKAEGV